MSQFGIALKHSRQQLKLTQLELARRSHISLATIQNLEAGRGNPSWETLQILFKILHLQLEIHSTQIHWPSLIALGCPLLSQVDDADLPPANLKLLTETLQSLDLSQFNDQLNARENQALASWLWAIRDHYPSIWKSARPPIQKWLNGATNLLSVKLRRLALSRLGDL